MRRGGGRERRGGGEGKEGKRIKKQGGGEGWERGEEGREGKGDEGKISMSQFSTRYCTSHDGHLHDEPQQSLVPSLRPLAPSVNHSYHQIIIIAYSNEGKERGENRRRGGKHTSGS